MILKYVNFFEKNHQKSDIYKMIYENDRQFTINFL